MKYIRIYTPAIALLVLLPSCNVNFLGYGIAGVVTLFALMFILFALMFYLIARRRKQGDKSLVKFANDVAVALGKLSTPQQKINMLNKLIERINNDEKYKKDTQWRDKVLAKTYSFLATAYYQNGDRMKALHTMSDIIGLDDTDSMAYYNRGSIYSDMGMYDKALADLNTTVGLLPDYASAYNNRGLVHEKMEHYGEALADFDAAIAIEPSAVIYFNRGNTHFQMEDYTASLGDYRMALEYIDGETQPDFKKEIEIGIKAVEAKL
ncbi:tetratricopeptide repeat protein [Dysgonomonas sp. 511]|nr:tetratricopeptide repeat protein [Dysgonomonas sp. 511]